MSLYSLILLTPPSIFLACQCSQLLKLSRLCLNKVKSAMIFDNSGFINLACLAQIMLKTIFLVHPSNQHTHSRFQQKQLLIFMTVHCVDSIQCVCLCVCCECIFGCKQQDCLWLLCFMALHEAANATCCLVKPPLPFSLSPFLSPPLTLTMTPALYCSNVVLCSARCLSPPFVISCSLFLSHAHTHSSTRGFLSL